MLEQLFWTISFTKQPIKASENRSKTRLIFAVLWHDLETDVPKIRWFCMRTILNDLKKESLISKEG